MSYHDADGNKVSLSKLVRLEPDWAATVIEHNKKQVSRLEQLNSEMLAMLKTLRHLDMHPAAAKDLKALIAKAEGRD